jgi:hypothetical protein
MTALRLARLDRGAMPVPVLHGGGLVRRGRVQVRQDERVAVDRIGFGELGDRQGALAGMQGAPPPGPGVGGDLLRCEADPADQQESVRRPPVRPVIGVWGAKSLLVPVSGGDGQARPWSMMISRVYPPALPDLRPALRLAGPARSLDGVQERGAARAAARGRRAAPQQTAATAGLGRPRGPRLANSDSAQMAAGAQAGHARHRPSLAPPPGQPEMDLSEPDGTAPRQRRDHRADRAARHRERLVGVPADPR